MDDIPEALRDAPVSSPQSPTIAFKWPIALAAGIGTIALGGILWFALRSPQPSVADAPETSASSVPEASSTAEEGGNTVTSDDLLGHLPYEEADPSELQSVVADGSIKLRRAAAEKYLQMEEDARAEGIYLAPLSGFRSVDDQQYLFFEVKAQRGQVATERAEVSAPPGYSEHHTGYAIDIGDANVPSTHVSPKFENTAAFEWLQRNAAYYSFELSFPRDNPQGVSYEPWHWRFVGDRHSLETFYKARSAQSDS